MFLAGVFFMFAPAGLLGDIAHLGGVPPSRILTDMVFSGTLSAAYLHCFMRRPRWLPLLIVVHVLLSFGFSSHDGQRDLMAHGATQARLATDTRGMIITLVTSLILFSQLVRSEGSRFVRAQAEIALASDIHRLLVPPIRRRIGQFEFDGVSLRSGDVGGDLIDLVESNGGWIAYVADVSGHGVGAGLLMGMVKSAARTELLSRKPIRF
jgi:hypothetical protein